MLNKDINLMPKAQTAERNMREAVALSHIICAGLIGACILILVIQSFTYGIFSYENSAAKKTFEKYNSLYQQTSQIAWQQDFIKDNIAKLAEIKKNDVGALNFLERLENVLPNDFALKNIEITEDKNVIIDGVATNEIVTADTFNALKSLLENATISGGTQNGRSEVRIMGKMRGRK